MPAARSDVSLELASGRGAPGRRRSSELVALASGLLVLVILAGIAFATTKQAWPAFSHEGLSFITSSDWVPAEDKFGALAFIYGTLLSSLIALRARRAGQRRHRPLHQRDGAPAASGARSTYVIDLLAAIPSVVYGLWGVLVFAPAVQPIYQSHQRRGRGRAGARLVLQRHSSGRSFMTAGIILAIMIMPIVTSLSRRSSPPCPPPSGRPPTAWAPPAGR